MDGWMAGLGAAQPPTTDALGQLLSDYSRCLYTSQLQHLKDIAGTLATEAAEDPAQVAKLRSALESVDHKRRKILQQMKNDAEMLNLESGAAPIRSPSTSAEDARLVSLISLDSILKQVKAVMNLKLSGSDNISSYMASISRLKSKALSILLQLCETESVSYLDEVASNTTTQNMAKSVGLEVLALLVKAWNRFKTGTGCSHYGRCF
ncbi:kinesin-like protein KIN-14A [Salvia splendens]|uniref:kinesin-like protein KIN-14A n=1 Tax=Salvia splendens TaxID=180675 RepID=UPI001C26AE2F|nr:kinesin-like protein KIN-14A [Salvia splendens]